MRRRSLASGVLGAVIVAAVSGCLKTGANSETRSAFTTPWSEPDLQGIWTDEYQTPLQRPARYAVKTEPRVRPDNVKEAIVVARELENQRLQSEEVAEFNYQPVACTKMYRMVVVKNQDPGREHGNLGRPRGQLRVGARGDRRQYLDPAAAVVGGWSVEAPPVTVCHAALRRNGDRNRASSSRPA